jgi:ribose transport system substrate-binding protein
MSKPFALVTAVAALLCCGCGGTSPQPQAQRQSPVSKKLQLAVIPKGTSHVFWQSIHAGANQAAAEAGVEVIWRGPMREDDRDSQVSEVEGFVSRGVAGIVLAPLDETALAQPVAEATRAGIPVVIIDSALRSSDPVSFVATNNTKGGRLAGEHMKKLLGGRGKLILLRHSEGHASTTEREDGFLAGVKQPGIDVVSSNQYTGVDVEGAYKKGEAVLSGYKRPDGSLSIDGIFTSNESSTLALLRVLQDNGWAGKVRFVGFDASDGLVKGMRDGAIDALVIQDPVRMGYLGVKTLVAYLRKEPIEKTIDTGVNLIPRDRMDEPAFKALLHPELAK